MVTKLLRIGLIIFTIFITGVTLVVATLGGVAFALMYQFNQTWDQTKLKPAYNTVIYASDNSPIAELHGTENRKPISLDDVPEAVVQAFIATEDARFFEHKGIDLKGIFRAAFTNLQRGYLAQGGSTISQQLARNAFLNQEKTLTRKVKEGLLALELERRYNKEEILTMYLNRIYFGHGAYGVESAAQIYFAKHVWDLTPEEAALLAGIPKNPARYSPYRYPEAAKERQGVVLDRLVSAGFIDASMKESLWQKKIKISGIDKRDLYRYPYFVDYVITEVGKRYGLQEEELYGGGYKIYTTVEPAVQTSMERVLGQEKFYPSMTSAKEQVQGAMAVVDHKHGQILGLVGGRDYQVRRGYNRATQLRRQPGSALKPIAVYAPALELGYNPKYKLSPQVKIGDWEPKNSGFGSEPITMETAVTHSVNGYAVKLLQKIGVDTGYEFAKRVGIPLVKEDRVPALALGGLSHGCAPLDLAGAYAAFANGGKYSEPIAVLEIKDPRGKVIEPLQQQRQEQVMSPENARVITSMLTKVVEEGTGKEAKLQRSVAGKTGTNGNKDIWFVGYTAEVVGAVWMGYDNTNGSQFLEGVYGGNHPARAWKAVMELSLPVAF